MTEQHNRLKEKIKDLVGHLKQKESQSMDDEALKEKTEECEKLVRENAILKHEMETIVMKLTKEIEERKKIEENLVQSLKDKSEECYRLDCENGQLKLDLQESREREEELGKQILLLKYDLEATNEYKEKFIINSPNLNGMLQIQKNANDLRGLGFEKGESSKSAHQKNNFRRPPVRQPNAHKFNGNYFVCNKFDHMAIQCRNRMNNNGLYFFGQCFKCNKYGHK